MFVNQTSSIVYSAIHMSVEKQKQSRCIFKFELCITLSVTTKGKLVTYIYLCHQDVLHYMTCFIREWNDDLVSHVCGSLADELSIAPGAPGGMETYRQSLTLSFFFKFYLKVADELSGLPSSSSQIVPILPSHRSVLDSHDEHKSVKSTQLFQVCEAIQDLASSTFNYNPQCHFPLLNIIIYCTMNYAQRCHVK